MRYSAFVLIISLSVLAACAGGPGTTKKDEKIDAPAQKEADVEAELAGFIERHVAKRKPLAKQNNLAFWQASITGDTVAYDKSSELELAIKKIFSDKDAYAYLKKVRSAGKVTDPLLKRQLEILYLDFTENQVDTKLLEKMVNLSTEVQQIFNTYRGKIDGREVTDGEIYTILKSSRDSKKRRVAWEAYKKRGELVAGKVIELARLRNQAARELGYENFYEMRLKLMEQDPGQIKKIFDDLAEKSDAPFAELMKGVSSALARRYGIKPGELRPWHYEDPFFQEGPAVGKVELDGFFEGVKQEKLIEDYFAALGMQAKDILERSDLYEKKGKMPHAFCTDIDREGDVRILANLIPSEMQTATLLHEMGHAVYDKYIDRELPWLLREASHPFTTEAVAMLFGRLTRNPGWLAGSLGLEAQKIDPLAKDVFFQQRLNLMVMARWTMVVVNFERGLYADPDQDLNKLWWDLKKRYQLLTPPEGRDAPDWASKIHIAAYPVYYHNYMLGEMMASQLHFFLAKKVLDIEPEKMDYLARTEIGTFLKEKIFAPGRSLRWDELLKQATGESLNPAHFAAQFVK